MGLFDYVKVVDYPLPMPPDWDGGLDFQTKSFESGQNTYELRGDGRFYLTRATEANPDWKPDPKKRGLAGLRGALHSVDKNEPVTMSGEVCFYTSGKTPDMWLEFRAYLENGVIVRLDRTSPR